MKIKLTAMVLLVTAIICLFSTAVFAGDTGTYTIDTYNVNLTPHSDGTVDIEYDQKWTVTDGHIPWITVGTPNSDYQIVASSGNVAQIATNNSSGWSGVRMDLDKDYQPGESFEAKFSITATKLFYADEQNYYLKFTPGWYDRAKTGLLSISIRLFADPSQVTFTPQPTRVDGEYAVWEFHDLAEGAKQEVQISFPKTVLAADMPASNTKDDGLSTGVIVIIVIVCVIALIFIVAGILDAVGGGGGYSGGGGVYYGSSGSGGSSRSGSGGGGFGGGGFSSGCACVSCACACACVGGGGAGCSRKGKHNCPECDPSKRLQL